MQWWVWLIIVIVAVGAVMSAAVAIQAKRRSGGVITKRSQ
jgi:hypothetical protein